MAAIVVAIDGPSGAGKSTIGRRLARRLQVPYIDTGAMYRAVGLAAQRRGTTLPIADPAAVVEVAKNARIDLQADAETGVRVLLDDEDVSQAIRRPEIAMYASAVSAISGVRRLLVERQREIGRRQGGVLEGRDIGTVVFPETPFKFFLTASPEVRAQRRHAELLGKGDAPPLATVLRDQEKRDRDDSTRSDSPLRCDDTYRLIDGTDLGIDEIVERMLKLVRE